MFIAQRAAERPRDKKAKDNDELKIDLYRHVLGIF